MTAQDPTLAWMDEFAAAADRHHAELGEADRRAGDGDYADNLRSALRRAAAARDAQGPRLAAFDALVQGFLGTGGTSGPLFGMWFREFARAAAIGMTTLSVAAAAAAGAASVQRFGRAEVGHKTMVDAMVPAADALRRASAADADLATALQLAAAAAHAGAEATRDLRAQRGRASYVGEHAVGVVDPGAFTVALFFGAGVVALRAEVSG